MGVFLCLLRIGFISTVGREIVPNIIRQFRELNPEVEVSLRAIPTADQAQMLETGSLDIGFLRQPIGGHWVRSTFSDFGFRKRGCAATAALTDYSDQEPACVAVAVCCVRAERRVCSGNYKFGWLQGLRKRLKEKKLWLRRPATI